MFKKSATLLLLLAMIPLMVSAQQKRSFIPKKPVVTTESTVMSYKSGNNNSVTADGNYVAVDTMANGFGPAIGILNPLAFDPYSGALAVVHRGKSTYGTSGQIWYNLSTDFGVTWTRVAGVNALAAQKFGRYPSMTISNPTHGDLSATTGLFTWPELVPAGAGFGGIGYGADQPLGGNQTFSDIINVAGAEPLYSSQVPCFASDASPYMYWVSDNQADNSVDFFRTQDFTTVDKIQPAEWNDTVWGGNTCIGGVSYKNTEYVGFIGSFNEVNNATGWSFGYSKSTDNGATWSRFNVVDWRTIPALAAYDVLFDATKGDAFVTYQGDIQVDANGHVHFVMPLTDTISGEHGNNALAEIFETATGWDGYVIATGLSDTIYTSATSPGLGQSGACAMIAVDSTRNVLAAQWTNVGEGGYADVFLSYRALGETSWSTPVNLTQSAGTNNNLAHFAPYLRKDGDNYTAFSMYNYPANGSLPGDPNLADNVIYVAPYTFTKVASGINDAVVSVNNYSLTQNYPNPFNPSTSFSYSVAERGNVSLKVFDVLGKEVATLVNGEKEKGSYSVQFNASNLASGLYIYTLKAGNTSISKKMMLMK